MIGPAGSGKSTAAKNLFQNCLRVCPDSVRRELFGDEADQREPAKVFETAYRSMEDAMCNGFDVVFDATNTTTMARKRVLDRVDAIQHTAVAVYMNTPLEECKRRNQQRGRVVPDSVIDRQYSNMLKDAGSIPYQFDSIVIVEGWRK
jgi:predicted kinase